MEKISSVEELDKFGQLLLSNGFTLIVPKDRPDTYFTFFRDGKFGYVQSDYFGHTTFSTKHKPNAKCGTGFRMHLPGNEDHELTLGNAVKTLNCSGIGEHYWHYDDIKYFTTVEEYMKHPVMSLYSKVIEPNVYIAVNEPNEDQK